MILEFISLYCEVMMLDIEQPMLGISPHTKRAYMRHIRNYLRFTHQIDEVDFTRFDIDTIKHGLSPHSLRSWLGNYASQGLGLDSIKQARSSIVWAAQLMADNGLIPYYVPAELSRIKVPRAERGQRAGVWLPPEEIAKMLVMLRRSQKAQAIRDSAIITLMAVCGLRREEVALIHWGDLMQQGRFDVIRVHGKGKKIRVVKLPDVVIGALTKWRNIYPTPNNDKVMFTRVVKGGQIAESRLSVKSVELVVLRTAKKAGIKRITPHDLRRSFARGAYEAGASLELIRQALGHNDISTTQRYVNALLELENAATDIYASRLEKAL
jgi:integrase